MNINYDDIVSTGIPMEEIDRLFSLASVTDNKEDINVLTKTLAPIVSDVAICMFSRVNYIECDNLINWGQEGLVQAIKTYDGICNFSTYGRAVIACVILDRIRGTYKDVM